MKEVKKKRNIGREGFFGYFSTVVIAIYCHFANLKNSNVCCNVVLAWFIFFLSKGFFNITITHNKLGIVYSAFIDVISVNVLFISSASQ